jgi:tRNA dimethylallyltransferase
MKLYRKLDIGTAKPDAAARRKVVHHLIDVIEPSERFSVADFLRETGSIIAGTGKEKIPLMAEGGTPLYLKALSEGLFEGPGRDEAVRKKLEEEAHKTGVESLHARLKSIDARAAGKILPSDLRRIVRALEVYELTGKPISHWQSQWGSGVAALDLRLACLTLPRKTLYERIDRRVDAMLDSGWLEECRELLKISPPLSKEASQALGYRTLFKVLQGETSLAEARARICFDTHHFARRQLGWFKRLNGIRFIEVAENEPPEKIAGRVAEAWESAVTS